MTAEKAGYWGRLLAALRGCEVEPAEPVAPDEQAAELRARIASLELDLGERDARIDQMRSEYGVLEAARDRAAAGAGQDELERLFKRVSGPLSNLAALTAMAEGGKEVEVGDLVQLVRDVEKELARAGLEPIGRVGEKTQFDVAGHQRMSGAAVRAGTPVTVRVPGYRFGEKVLFKAMVSAVEKQDG